MTIAPLELIDQCIGKVVTILMNDEAKEFRGKLLGYDDFVNVVLEKVTERVGEKEYNSDKIFLNGNNIVMLVPGEK